MYAPFYIMDKVHVHFGKSASGDYGRTSREKATQ